MRIFSGLLLLVLVSGCAGTKPQGVSVSDPLDAVKVDQMTGNNVSGAVFARTLVCLNARRETRWLTAITNQSVALITNVSLSYVTNQTTTLTTNQQQTLATNLATTTPVVTGETNVTAPANPLPGPSTNVAVTTASNVTLSKAGNQTSTTANFQTQRTRQFTTTADNVSITTADNQIVTAETNLMVTVLTNLAVTSVTKLNVFLTNAPVQEHFLILEYTPPPDFTLATGDSLVLLVDGSRHVLSPGSSQSVIVPARGFNAVAYKTTPQLLVDIANAKQVKLRIKGSNQIIERDLNSTSRANFKKFLVKFFAPEKPATKSAASGTPTRTDS